ncbi:MAG: Ig-like domain-containing protein [Candidatus Paceibacterota bacterium]
MLKKQKINLLKTLLFITIFLGGSFLFGRGASAATYYVDNQLSDNCTNTYSIASRTCTGSDGSAYKSFSVMPAFSPGDIINIRGGTYSGKIYPAGSGTSSSYITYQNYNNESVIISGNGRADPWNGIQVNNKQYLQFKGIKVTNQLYGIYIYNGSSNIIIDGIEAYGNILGISADGNNGNPVSYVTIKNSLSHNNTSHGIFINSRVYDTTIMNNTIYSNRQVEGTYSGTDFTHGIEVSYDYSTFSGGTPTGNEDQTYWAKRITVIGNEIYDNACQGIRTGGVSGILIKDNYTHDNGATGIQLEDITDKAVVEGNRSENNAKIFHGETGIWVDNSINVVVKNNYTAGNDTGILVGISRRVILRNNIVVNNNFENLYNSKGMSIYGNSHDVAVAHNTLSNYNGSASSSWPDMSICLTTMYNQPNYYSPSTGFHLKNNIFSNTSSSKDFGVECTDYTSDNELFYNTRPVAIKYLGSSLSLAQYITASGKDTYSLEQNPLFTSDYHLQSGSPAVDAGAFLATTIGSGNGTTIAVNDASYFTDGFGIAEGDLIKVGNDSSLRITNVNYDSNTITLNQSIQWTDGEGVSFLYNGTSPDIGAYESEFVVAPPPVSDTTSPTISITAPTASASVSGNVTISATASDNVGVIGVQFKLDGTNLGEEDFTSPYSITWNTTASNNGAHSLTAVARDAAGNSTTSTALSVTVSNTVATTVPPAGGGGGGGGGSSTVTTVFTNPITNITTTTLTNTTTVPGCDNRTSGFSTTTGQACAGNVTTSTTTTIPGCDNRNTGFSITTGQSCIGNTVTASSASISTNTTASATSSTPSTSSGPSAYNFGTSTLKNGSKGEAVKELQRFLNQALNLGLVVDGKLGPKTVAVVKKWQKDNGLVADGLVGNKTKAKMNESVR